MTAPLTMFVVDLAHENLNEILSKADTYLLKATNNFEVAVELECRAREKYYEKFNACFLAFLRGAEKVGEKVVAQSVAEKAARSVCGPEFVDYENAQRRAEVAEEKMNSIKKLLDQRGRLGG